MNIGMKKTDEFVKKNNGIKQREILREKVVKKFSHELLLNFSTQNSTRKSTSPSLDSCAALPCLTSDELANAVGEVEECVVCLPNPLPCLVLPCLGRGGCGLRRFEKMCDSCSLVCGRAKEYSIHLFNLFRIEKDVMFFTSYPLLSPPKMNLVVSSCK